MLYQVEFALALRKLGILSMLKGTKLVAHKMMKNYE